MTRTVLRTHPLERYAPFLWVALAAWLLAAAPVSAQEGYSYLRTVEGYANLESSDDGVLEGVENQPLIPGDSLIVGASSRVEVVLSDGAILRLADGEVRFDALALTPDTGDTLSRLAVVAGQLQVVLHPDSESPLEIETANATLYLEAPGEYLVTVPNYDRTSVAVRQGYAEAQTDRGSVIVRSGEAAYVDGTEWASVEVAAAGRRSRLELWGDELEAEARLAQMPYVEPGLRYRAARMANHGAWIEYEGRWAWRPHVTATWRPYVHGVWRHTPSGLTWISNEPWGWVPSHYGSWDLVPGYGWVWFAGSHYTPASVYWYWGPTHVAWVPAGYYTSFYSPHRRVAPRFGIYGWAGGDWGFFAEWTFCPTRYFGRGRYDRYFRSGREVARHASYREIPRGVIATDTRPVRRDVWGQPERIVERLVAADTRLSRGSLPDVTDFVARRKELGPEIAEVVRPREIATLRSRGASAEGTGGFERRAVETRAVDRRVMERPAAGASDRVGSQSLQRGERPGRPSLQRGDERSAVSSHGRTTTRFRGDDRTLDTRDRPELRDVPGRLVIERGHADRSGSESRSDFIGRSDDRTSVGREIDASRLRLGRDRSDTTGAAPPASGDDRAVVRRVIEQMRSRQAPPAQRPSARSEPPSRPPRATSSTRGGDSSRSRGSVRSSGDSRRSRASSGSGRSTSRSNNRARARSRKPPGAGPSF